MAILTEAEMPEVEMWRNVFLRSDDGKKVLERLIVMGHVLETVEPGDIAGLAVRNHVLWILYQLGIAQDMNIGSIVDKLATIPYKGE